MFGRRWLSCSVSLSQDKPYRLQCTIYIEDPIATNSKSKDPIIIPSNLICVFNRN